MEPASFLYFQLFLIMAVLHLNGQSQVLNFSNDQLLDWLFIWKVKLLEVAVDIVLLLRENIGFC